MRWNIMGCKVPYSRPVVRMCPQVLEIISSLESLGEPVIFPLSFHLPEPSIDDPPESKGIL